jgi:hypothetical protein
MKRHVLALSAIALAATIGAAHAQSTPTRSNELPGNQPIAGYSVQQREFMRTYVRARPQSEWQGNTAVGVPGSAQSSANPNATSAAGANVGGNIALGANVPSSVTTREVVGNPAYSGFRYGRFGNQYVIVDSTGKIVDTFE